MLRLEDESVARARGARVLARVLGVARARGDLGRAALVALETAGVSPEPVGLVVGGASGGARARDELRELARVFAGVSGERAYVSPHATLGEGFAFTSAAAALAGVLALCEQRIPAFPGALEGPAAPGLGLSRESRGARLSTVLVVARSSLGAGVAVVLGVGDPDSLSSA